MPLAANENATKAMHVSPKAAASSSTPAAAGAANTSEFLTHCFGRAVRTIAPAVSPGAMSELQTFVLDGLVERVDVARVACCHVAPHEQVVERRRHERSCNERELHS